jgi:hypothetical protein
MNPQVPVLYERDDAARRVILTVAGVMRVEDLADAADRQAGESAWSYGVLLDTTDRLDEPMNAASIRVYIQHLSRISRTFGEPGPMAIVPHDLTGYGMARMFQSLSGLRSERPIAVFNSIAAAGNWLDQQRRHPGEGAILARRFLVDDESWFVRLTNTRHDVNGAKASGAMFVSERTGDEVFGQLLPIGLEHMSDARLVDALRAAIREAQRGQPT